MHDDYISLSSAAARDASIGGDIYNAAASAAAGTAHEVALVRTRKVPTDLAYSFAAAAIADSQAVVPTTTADLQPAFLNDVQYLYERGMAFDTLVDLPLWHTAPPPFITGKWNDLTDTLHTDGDHWWIWINWYNDILLGRPSSERADLAYVGGYQLRDQSARSINTEIARQLDELRPDPSPIEGISSPITIAQRPDGRIGVEAGPFSLPTVPEPLTSADHQITIAACRSRAVQLIKIASAPHFQHRAEYAEVLSDYLDWLPSDAGSGNMLLADGEARVLNKLFTAEEGILRPDFASKLSVLLEDHIGLRSFYPQVERHYHAVSTGRLIKPLARDAVEAMRRVIDAQTPAVFDETVSPAIAEAAKPVPDISLLPPEDLPPADPSRPKPPTDPIADADPRKSRDYTIASAYNRIWSILQKGKDASQAIEGWQKTYDMLKPHIGPIIDFLRSFLPP